jgi:D-glycero-alpha-D-manno-heptose-7-phosphate kinase
MIISKTPLRISFFGGNTDFREYYFKYGGLVLSTTIDKFIYCIVVKRFDDLIIVNYSQKETVENVDHLQHDLVRESLKLLGITKGIEITFLSDIPTEGCGLGSSGAVTVGVLNALHTYLGENVSSQQLAEEAIKIELDILNHPSGVQDQHIAAMGGFRAIEFSPSGKVWGMKLKMEEPVKTDLNNSLMLIYTGLTRRADSILSSLNIDDNKVLLDQNKLLANDAVVTLLKGNLNKFAKLLNTSWEAKKVLNSKTSNPDIDNIYEKVMKSGAVGAKIIGAGAGGFMLVMFPPNKRIEIRQKLEDYQELPFRFEDSGSKIIFNV